MDEDEILRNIICIILGIGLFYVIFKTYQASLVKSLKTNNKEGFDNGGGGGGKNGLTSNAKKFNDMILSDIESIKDSINISKYRADYENIITNYEEYLHYLMLKKILLTKDLTSNYKENMAVINDIVNMDKTITVLHNLLNYIDNK